MTEKKINFFLDTPKSLRYNTNTNNGDKMEKAVNPTQKLTVVRFRRSLRGGESWETTTLTRAEIQQQYPSWNGESHILRADYRLGLSITIRELNPKNSK